jgi:hypothetical protein
MRSAQTSTVWLSEDMAHALAAMCPPLDTTDVQEAANLLATDGATVQVLDRLLRLGPDLMMVRRVVEALHALRDARVTDSSLAAWLLARESEGEVDVPGLLAAAERACQKLAPRLSQLVSTAGTQALLARSLHVARAKFPFLAGVRVGPASEPRLLSFCDGIYDVERNEATKALRAILAILLNLLVGFIGADLTLTLVREVWPDLPVPSPGDRPFGESHAR